jgi:hypothetical protein
VTPHVFATTNRYNQKGIRMDSSGFFDFIILALLVILISVGLDRLYARIAPFRLLYYALRFPGVVLHEIAHVMGCVVSRAEIKKIILFSENGGSVTYVKPKIPLLGTVIISTAPLFVLPLTLAGLTWIFGTYLGCYVPPVFPSGEGTVAGFYGMIHEITLIFSTNLLYRFNGWFLVYLYLTGSIILSLAPSGQDFLNAAVGIVLMFTLCLFVIWAGFPGPVAVIGMVIAPMKTAFSIGLMYEVIAAFVSVPFILIHGIMRA